MQPGWVKIYTTDHQHLAEIIKGTLLENDVTSIVMNKMDSVYVNLGEIEVYVQQKDAIKALHIIKQQNQST